MSDLPLSLQFPISFPIPTAAHTAGLLGRLERHLPNRSRHAAEPATRQRIPVQTLEKRMPVCHLRGVPEDTHGGERVAPLPFEAYAARALRASLEEGLPLTPQPYLTLARALGLTEQQVIVTIQSWLQEGSIKRFGLVVRHQELGYRANAMVVWQVPREQVDRLGEQLKLRPEVTLCYRRTPRPPVWPYNLFCMIHGQDRNVVMEHIETIVTELGIESIPRAVLFSKQRFKQRGGRFCTAAARTKT